MAERRVLICGSRFWNKHTCILKYLQSQHELNPIACVIEGECRGADKMGRWAAEQCGIPVKPFPADWRIGKRAGPIRNQQMLDEGKPTEVWAFHNDISNSSGTADMVAKSRRAGIPVFIISEKNTS